jgi:gliding motility-associated-like protein
MKKVSFLIILSFLTLQSLSQIFVPYDNYDYTDSTKYGEDTLFVFYSDNPDKILNAEHSTLQVSDFTWKRYNKSTETFDSLFTHTDTTLSAIWLDSLYNRGYISDAIEGLRVEITDNSDSLETYTAWVISDTFPDFGEIWVEYNTCTRLWLAVQSFTLPDYKYYDYRYTPAIDYTIYNNRSVTWQASAQVEIFDDQTLYNFGNIFVGKIGQANETNVNMPFEDSDYYLRVENKFGNSRGDTIENVLAKGVKADFDVFKILDDGTSEEYSEEAVNEAMLQVSFENQSENATQYQWTGYNDSLLIASQEETGLAKDIFITEVTEEQRDSILWESDSENPGEGDVPAYRPGKYRVKLTASNSYGCSNDKVFRYIKADSSLIDTTKLPNVFTPNGDGRNDYFVIPKESNVTGDSGRGIVSMKEIEITIVNRAGDLVYKYRGKPEDWEGWNGKVKNSNRDAAEGIYVYIITGMGYDHVKHSGKQNTGFLYLYR